jgi:hypothetical protein
MLIRLIHSTDSIGKIMANEQDQELRVLSEDSALLINYEWELHTCKRGHTWRFPKENKKISCNPFLFTWTNADGVSCSAGTGAICLQCYCDDLVSSYGPIKTTIESGILIGRQPDRHGTMAYLARHRLVHRLRDLAEGFFALLVVAGWAFTLWAPSFYLAPGSYALIAVLCGIGFRAWSKKVGASFYEVLLMSASWVFFFLVFGYASIRAGITGKGEE